MSQLCQTTFASSYFPNIYYIKPSNEEPYLFSPSITYTAGFANEAFNKDGKSVPYLQQYGPEDFLLRFVDPSLGPDNLESAGQGYISGKYHFKQFNFIFEKNIFHYLLIGMMSVYQNLDISDITPRFIYDETSLLPSQVAYLEKLERVIPKSISATGMFSTFLYIAYNEKFTSFQHIDYLSTYLFAGLGSPQAMKNDNTSILQYPLSSNIFFKYPVIGAISIGVREWFSLGLTALAVFYQDAQTTIPINKTGENNFLLFSQSTQATIKQSPFVSGTIFFDFTKPDSRVTGTIVYSYSCYLDSTIIPINTEEFPYAHANTSILHDGYNLGALLFQLTLGKPDDTERITPIVSMFIALPITGHLFQKAYVFGSGCNLQVSYVF